MILGDEINEQQTSMSEPPRNESNTCDWIILPLLYAAGYSKRDIESRVSDSTGKYPDYALLPNNPSAAFYLEAKAWNETLEAKHVQQSLNYANHNGKHFVVLTNGQSWQLYDNAIQGVLGEKLIVEAGLRDTPRITDFLTALSKTEVLNGSLEKKAAEVRKRKVQEKHDLQERQQREERLRSIQKRQTEIRELLDATLPDLLNDSESDLVVSLARRLSEKEEFGDLAPETLSAWFTENLHQPLADSKEISISPGHVEVVHTSFSERQEGRTMTLKDLQGTPIDGDKSKPITFRSPDGIQTAVRSWVSLAEHVVHWLLQQPQPMPLPFEASNRERWFLNYVPEHKRPDRRKKFKTISTQGKTVYMDADRTGKAFLEDINALCLAMRIDPKGFQVTVLF